MKKTKHYLITGIFLLMCLNIFGQAFIEEADPQRGLYIDNFITFQSQTIYTGRNLIDPVHSILGVDENHDGVFEKEQAVLLYCRSNHITSIVLLDLHKILGANVLAWNQNLGRFQDMEEHLCRFMEDARRDFCISEIVAAGQTSGYFHRVENFMNQFSSPTPAFRFSSSQLSNPNFSNNLMIAQDTTLNPGDSLFEFREIVKFYLRIGTFGGGGACTSRFNRIHMEYEFWQPGSDDFLDATVAGWNPALNINGSCSSITSGSVGLNHYYNGPSPCANHNYPSYEQAKFDAFFVPVINSMRSVKKLVNAGLSQNDPNYLKTEAYLHSIFTLTNFDAFTLFTDGDPNTLVQSTMNLNDQTLFDLNHTAGDPPGLNPNPDFSMLPNIDRPLMAEFSRFYNGTMPTISNLDYSALFEYRSYWPQPSDWIHNYTDVHPLLNAESVANNGYDDYWGYWFNQGPNNNLFQAEKMHYNNWRNSASNNILNITSPIRNNIQRGGFLWYAQSQMVEANFHDPMDYLDHPSNTRIFYTETPICTSSSTVDVAVHYIGPSEASDQTSTTNQVKIEFWLTDCNNLPILGQPSITSPIVERTYNAHDYFEIDPSTNSPHEFAAPDIILNLSPTNCNYKGHMKLTYVGGCTYEYQSEIVVSNGPTIVASGDREICEGENLFLIANDGGSGATYTWYNNNHLMDGVDTRQISVTSSGKYKCIIAGGTSCDGTSNELEVLVHPNPVVSITRICTGFAGPVILSADNNYNNTPPFDTYGPGGVTYQWSNGETTDRILVDLAVRANDKVNYSVTVTTPEGCVRTDRKYIDSESFGPSMSVITGPASSACRADGTASITVNATPPYRLVLSNGVSSTTLLFNTGTGPHLVDNLLPGNYTLTLSESFGSCISENSFTIGASNLIPVTATVNSTNANCGNVSNGTITVTGVGPQALFDISIPSLGLYQYNVTSYTFTNIPPGSYTVRIDEAAGGNCGYGEFPVAVSIPGPELAATCTTENVKCNVINSGSAVVNVLGGSGNYSYLWSNGATTSTITGLAAGSYNLVISDDVTDCELVLSVQISNPIPIAFVPEILNPCPGLNNGHIAVLPVNGTGPYTLNAPWYFQWTRFHLDNLSAGIYTLNVTDANGCTATEDFEVLPALSATVNVSNEVCNNNNGMVEIIPSGGNPPYQYSWSSSSSTQSSLFGLTAGTYTCTLTDGPASNSCSLSVSGVVTDVPDLLVSATYSSYCNGATATSVTLSATGGDGTYTIIPSGLLIGVPFLVNTTNNLTYIVQSGSCSGTVTVNPVDDPPINVTITSAVVDCNAGTAEVTVNAVGGTGLFVSGVGTFIYPSNSTRGVQDSHGCYGYFTVPSQSDLSATATSINVSCPTCTDGQVSISTITGGVGPYTFTNMTGLSPGNYCITVTDANGCTTSACATVNSGGCTLVASSTAGTIACFGGTTTVTVSATGGTAPYTGTGAQTVNAGPYSFTVTDASGCTSITSGSVIGPTASLVASSTAGTIACFGGTTTVTVSATGGTAPYTGTGAQTVSADPYTFTVTDANGCTSITSGSVTGPTASLIASSTAGTIACFGGTTTVTVSATGGTAPYSGTGAQTVSAGPYTFTVTDANGCTSITSGSVTGPTASLVATSTAGTIACFGGTTTVTVSATGGTAPYTGTGAQTVSAGPYTFTVTDANGCTSVTTGNVTQPTQLVASSSIYSLGCSGGTSTVTVSAQGGTTPYTGTGSYNVVAGTYSYTVSDARACSSTTTITVVDDVNCCYIPGGEIVGSTVTVIPTGNYFGIRSLNHNVEINSAVQFSSLDLTIGAGRTITVQPTGILTIQANSYLHACTNMWNGIINNGGTVIIMDSQIDDAIEAVLTIQGNLQVDHSIFDHNFVGLHFLGGTYDPGGTWVRSSTFDCVTGQITRAPHVGDLTRSHVIVENVNNLQFGTGNSTFLTNNIRNANIGLTIISSNISVFNNRFEFMNYPFNNSNSKFTAISASGNNGNLSLPGIQIGNLTAFNRNTILNWKTGILTSRVHGVNIENNILVNNPFGINNIQTSVIRINNNEIREFTRGIYCYNNSGTIRINNNIFNTPITTNFTKNIAIRVENPTVNSINLNIEANVIFNASTGILCRNVPKAIVGKANRIYYYAPNATLATLGFNEAISLENCNDSYVLLNEVYRYIDPDPLMPEIMRGISLDKTMNAYVYGNNLRKMGQGIKFYDKCENTQLHCNVMLDNYNGVYFDNSSQSDQGIPSESWDNYWNNQVNSGWNRVWGNNPLNIINWYYDASSDNNYNPNPHIFGFINDVDLTPHGSCPDPTLVQISKNIEDDLKDIAYDLKQYSDFNGEMKYENKEFFYEKVKEDPSLLNRGLPEDLVFQQLYNSLRTGNIGAFDDVKTFVKNNDFAQAYLKNLTIVSDNAIEENKKVVNEIYLSCAKKDTLPDSLQISVLEDIAYHYPSAGGEAVYWARAILHLDIEDNLISLRRRNTDLKEAEVKLGRMFPNPANETVIYEFPLKPGEEGRFEIYDQLNKKVLIQDMFATQLTINTSTFRNGVYNCRFIIEGKIVDYQKLVIVK